MLSSSLPTPVSSPFVLSAAVCNVSKSAEFSSSFLKYLIKCNPTVSSVKRQGISLWIEGLACLYCLSVTETGALLHSVVAG